MLLFGKEYGFLYSVGADQELRELMERKSRPEASGTNRSAALDLMIERLCILSRWYEKARKFEDASYTEAPLTPELIRLLPVLTFNALQLEAVDAMARDTKQTVEAEKPKKEKAP